jgi:CBS domain-containing protein
MADTVRQIMDADPVTVAPTASIEEVVRLMRERELPGLPVVEDDGTLVGIVTESDLVIPDEQGDLHLPHYLQIFGGFVFVESLEHFEERLRKATAATAADMMSGDPTTVTPDASVGEAARIISESGHNRLPVVEGDRLVGVVTRVDVLGALAAGA